MEIQNKYFYLFILNQMKIKILLFIANIYYINFEGILEPYR